MSYIGVFLCCKNALATISQFGLPSDLVAVINALFEVFTEDSALMLEWGLYSELTLWLTPHLFKKPLKECDMN